MLIALFSVFQHLNIFVFDDADPEEASYIGKAMIPLMTLRHMKELKGTYPLVHQTAESADVTPDREQSLGTIDVEMYWQHEYIRPKKPKHAPLEVRTCLACLECSYNRVTLIECYLFS